MEQLIFTLQLMSPKVAYGMANSVDPDQTAPKKEQSDQGLHCLFRPICDCPNTLNYTV